AALVGAGTLVLQAKGGGAPQLPDRKFVAVMSIGDVAGEPSLQRIGDGFAETVRSRLTSARSLQVVPTRTPAQPGRREADLGRLAREIGANLLVCISFWIQGDNVRATYRIVTDEGAFVKSGSVDGSMTN